MKARKAVRDAVVLALGEVGVLVSTSLSETPGQQSLPRAIVRLVADSVDDDDGTLRSGPIQVEGVLAITVLTDASKPDQLEDLLGKVHAALMKDDRLGGTAQGLAYSDYALEVEEGIAAGTHTYTVGYPLE